MLLPPAPCALPPAEQDSEFFDQLFAEIVRATHHVHLETFLWENGFVSDRVVEALTECVRRGIETRVLTTTTARSSKPARRSTSTRARDCTRR
ncbi:MAG: hypothetical protein ACXW4P_04670 [Thermoanaerobaculia bacterium]